MITEVPSSNENANPHTRRAPEGAPKEPNRTDSLIRAGGMGGTSGTTMFYTIPDESVVLCCAFFDMRFLGPSKKVGGGGGSFCIVVTSVS